MLRVAMVAACPYFVPQGSQVLVRDTARALQGLGHEIRLVVYGYGADDAGSLPIHRGLRLPGSRKTSAGPSLVKPLLDAALVQTLRRVVREHAIDLVHAHNYEGLLVALAAGKRPVVYHAHNAMADELPYYFGRRAGRFGRWLDATFPRRADHVVAPHTRLREYLIVCGCDPARVSVIAPPAEVEFFDGDEALEENPPVLYAGNLDAYQNLPLLAAAMRRVREARRDTRCVIATAADANAPIVRAIPGAEVAPTPDREALRAVLRRDAVFACPRVSWSGYAIKLLNAMAAGRAVVACAGAAHPLTDGVNGLVVPDNDAEAFAGALLRLMADPELRRTLGVNARRTIAEAHHPELIARALDLVYATVA